MYEDNSRYLKGMNISNTKIMNSQYIKQINSIYVTEINSYILQKSGNVPHKKIIYIYILG